MRRVALLSLTVLAVAWPAAAHAAAPCRDRIYNEWYSTGKISTNYPLSCYGDALKHVPPDAAVYSNLGSDIRAALLAARARKIDPAGVPKAVGRGLSAPALYQTKGAVTTKTGAKAAGMVADPASGSGGVPTPVYILGGVALALAAAGAAGTGWRYMRRN